MQKVFFSLRELDIRASELFGISSELLMENAARGMAEYLGSQLTGKSSVVQIICGTGDNGADGLALARMIADMCTLRVVMPYPPRSALCVKQAMRLTSLDTAIEKTMLPDCDFLIDAFLGTGLSGKVRDSAQGIIQEMNRVRGKKIACDIPSGLSAEGQPMPEAVNAHVTLSMGGLKTAFYSDAAKDITGKIMVVNLGLPQSRYEIPSTIFLLEKTDFFPPVRKTANTHKGSYGHAAVLCGEKEGACILASMAALSFGAGAVSVFGEKPPLPPQIMYNKAGIPPRCTACCIGPGLGNRAALIPLCEAAVKIHAAIILDADAVYADDIADILAVFRDIIITPHPKEFSHLLQVCGFGSISAADIQRDRIHLLKKFCQKYPSVVVLLKGAVPLIGNDNTVYINPHGTAALAKAGSGDVLAGLVTALRAQGYPPIKAAIQASLAHALASTQAKTSYGCNPQDLIELIKKGNI